MCEGEGKVIRIAAEKLTAEAFAPFGTFVNLVDPEMDFHLGDPEVSVGFQPALLQVDLGPNAGNQLEIGVCKVGDREKVAKPMERHWKCGELILPYTGDIVIVVGPPSVPNPYPAGTVKAFYVPCMTAVSLKRAVLHWAPFSRKGQEVRTIIGLPPGTWGVDCDDTFEAVDETKVGVIFDS